MKQTLILGALLLCFSLSSCQCADPPPVGPVDDDEQAHVDSAPEAAIAAVRLV